MHVSDIKAQTPGIRSEIPTTTPIPPCPKETSEQAVITKQNHIKAVEAAFNSSEHIDLLFLFDRSKSIADIYNKSKSFLTENMIPYLYEYRSFRIHPDYVRVRFQTFGSLTTTEFSNVEEGDKLHCKLTDEIDRIYYNISDNEGTDLDKALDTVVNLYRTSIKLRKLTDRILWIITDGWGMEDTKPQIRESIRTLKETLNFTIFTVGENGLWFAYEDGLFLRDLATSSNHYACLDNWIEYLKPSKPFSGENETCWEKPNRGTPKYKVPFVLIVIIIGGAVLLAP